MSSYVTRNPVGMTHICSSLINSERTFHKGQGADVSLGTDRRSDSLILPYHHLSYREKEITGQILLSTPGLK